MSYRITREAQRDLKGIVNYTISHWGKQKSQAYLTRLQHVLSQLAEMPEMGQNRFSELGERIYSFPCVSHMIYYLHSDADIVVLAVLHQSQAPAHHLITRR